MTSDPAAGPVATPPADTPDAGQHRAGPYGFSRFEIGGLLTVVVIVGLFGVYRWSGRRAAATTPGWVIEDVVFDRGAGTVAEPETSPVVSRHDSVPATPRRSATIDINSAGESELDRLPGIGRELARRIVHDRQVHGPFRDLLDLQRVNGIGPKKAAALAGWVRFADAAADTVRTDDE